VAAGRWRTENPAEIDAACVESIVWSSDIRLATAESDDAATIDVVVDEWLKPSTGPAEITVNTTATAAKARQRVRMSRRSRILVLVPVQQMPGSNHIVVEPAGDSAVPYIDALDIDGGVGLKRASFPLEPVCESAAEDRTLACRSWCPEGRPAHGDGSIRAVWSWRHRIG
jgi:hypothetical protein